MAELTYRQRLKLMRENKLSKAQIIENSVANRPKTINEIAKNLAIHGHSKPIGYKRLKKIFKKLDIIGIPTLCSPDKLGDKGSQTYRYGHRTLIEKDFQGSPDDCNYINRTTWFHRQTLNDFYYRGLEKCIDLSEYDGSVGSFWHAVDNLNNLL
tara:strand:+ start:1058 stop:1519 length:462 start_codon:yes stop_codon:yes gene_type:complete